MRRVVLSLAIIFSVAFSLLAAAPPVVGPPPANDVLLLTPYQGMEIAYKDAKTNAPLSTYYRYLRLPNGTKAERLKLKQTADFVINSLSRRRLIVQTTPLPDANNPIILRVDLNAYGIDYRAWDELAEKGSGAVPLPEPYHYIPVEREVTEDWPGGVAADGKTYKPGPYKIQKKTIAMAPWLTAADNGAMATEFLTLTSKDPLIPSKAPILRADWFVSYAAVAPAYYRLLGLKAKEAEFEELLKRDKVRAAPSLIAGIADSRLVTLHNRILNREPTVQGYTSGYIWFSIDTDTGIDREDYLNNIDTFDTPVVKAKEMIGTLLNTLQAYAVSNGKGDLVNVADPNIALHSDSLPTRLQDKKIYSGLRNCVFCHHGLQTIACQVRARAQGNVGLAQLFSGRNFELKVRDKITDAFGLDINELVTHDNAIHTNAIRAVNGLEPKVNATQFEDFTYSYLEAPITLERAVLETGYKAEDLLALIKASVGSDYTIVGLAQQPPLPAHRLAWERRGFIQLMLLTTAVPKP